MTEPSEAEVTEAMVEAGVAAFESQAPRLVSRSPSYSDPLAVALRHSFVRHILTAALSTPPLPSAEPDEVYTKEQAEAMVALALAADRSARALRAEPVAWGETYDAILDEFAQADARFVEIPRWGALDGNSQAWVREIVARLARPTPAPPSFPDGSYDHPLALRLRAASQDGPSIPRLGITGTDKHSVPLTSAEATVLLSLLTPPAAAQDRDLIDALVREVDDSRDLLADAYVTIGRAVESEDGLDGSEADRFQEAVRRLWPAAVDHPTVARWLALPEESPTPEAPDAARAAGGEPK